VEEVRLKNERVYFRHAALNDGKEMSLPLGQLAVYWRENLSGASGTEIERRRLAAATRVRDALLLQNGDTIEGSLNSIDATNAEIEVNRKPVRVELSRIGAVALNTELADRSRPRGAYARVALSGPGGAAGTRLTLVKATSDGTTLTGTAAAGTTLNVPLVHVAALDLFQGRAVYLSDLKPARAEAEPYLNVTWPTIADGNAAGQELRLSSGVFDKGLGMHARSTVTYRLDGSYRRFEAVVGLDPRCGRDGGARIGLRADGKRIDLGGDGLLRGSAAPLTVSVDLTGIKVLTLEADFGPRGDVRADVNWVDARLVK
jgi:hypothetical protein